jgi:hypothetical protein
MNNIEIELETLRRWFLEHHEYSISNAQLIQQKYNEILTLLKKGGELGMTISGNRYSSLHEFLSSQLGRIKKIQNPNGIILTGEINRSPEELYKDVCSVVVIQLANPHIEL